MSNVSVLLATNPTDWNSYLAKFKNKLKKLNPSAQVSVYPSGGAGGVAAAVQTAAMHLAGDKSVDVIVTSGTMAALACKQATQVNQKPFVFASVGDAALSGLSPQPGGNFTGGCNGQVAFVPQRVTYMLKNSVFVDKFAVVGNDDKDPANPVPKAMDAAVIELTNRGKQVQREPLVPGSNIDKFISGLQGVHSLYVCSDLWITVQSTTLNNKARKAGMETMWEIEEQKTIHNATDAYGVSFVDMFEKAAEFVDKILKGAKAGDLPLYQPVLAIKRKGGPSRPTKSRTSAAKKRGAPRSNKSRASATKKRPAKKKGRRGR
jgi:ABC-type uncharacterized transport system substrate-binding protein